MRRMLAIAAAMAWAALAAPAVQAANPPANAVVIAPGERIEFTLGPSGTAEVTSRGPMSAEDANDLPSADNGTESLITVPLHAHVTPGRFTAMLTVGADGTTLILLNGYEHPIGYRAALVTERDGQRVYTPTSVCPVRAGKGGIETWPGPVVGIALTGLSKADPNNLKCSEDSLLTVAAPEASPDRFVCSGGGSSDLLAPLTVDLTVNASGAIQQEDTSWVLSKGGQLAEAPALSVRFGMLGRKVMSAPAGLSVLAMVGLNPAPKAKTADIVLLLNGVEKVRQPWKSYANALTAPTDPKKTPMAYFGVIPMGSGNNAGLSGILAAIGRPGTSLEVRIVDDDGSVLSRGTYAVDRPLTRDGAHVEALLDQALALARTPTKCQKLDP